MLKSEIIPASTYTFVAKDGTLKHIEIHGSPLVRDGQVAGTISVARDITERKLIEEKLRFEEKRFRAFVEHSSDILVLMNLEGTIAYTNPAVEQVLGFKPEERIGAKGFELVHPDELKFLADSFNILARDANAPVIKGEMHLRHKDGSWRTLEAVGSNLVNNNVVEAIIVNYRDITDRKRAEEELRESEERYRELVKYAPAGIYEVDYETNLFIGVNEVICEYSGYSRDELLTTNFFNLFTEESQKLMLARLEKLMANENIPQTAEYCIRTKGGEELWVHLSARYIYESGKLKGATGVVYNITERKKAESQREAALDALRKSEDKYRTLIETTNTGYVIIDQDGLVLDANSEYVRLTGHHDLSEIVGRSVMEWTAESEKEKNAAAVKACFDKGYIRNLEIDYVDAKGNVTPIEINATCMEIEKKIFTITICRDITERKQAEDALRESEKKYRELSIIDDLTQLYNSRHFYAQLEIEIERSNRYGQPLTLLLLDLDKFKKFNDKYGHVEGDHVLSQLGQVIKRCLRDPDSAYRYGGEEFTIMLPMTTRKREL